MKKFEITEEEKQLILKNRLEKLDLEKYKKTQPSRIGILKHDLYLILQGSKVYSYLDNNVSYPISLKEKQKMLSNISKEIKIICLAGTEFLSYKDPDLAEGKEYWFEKNHTNDTLNDFSEIWAKENLKNIEVIKYKK